MKTRIFVNTFFHDEIEYLQEFDNLLHRMFDYEMGIFKIKNVHPIKDFSDMKELVRYED